MTVVLPFLFNTLFNFVIGLLVAKFLGPDEYGRFALTLAVGMATQTLLFDWIRLAATRFYSERERIERPQMRATLDAAFALLIGVACVVGVGVMVSGVTLPLSNALIGAAVASAVASGLFDYQTAMVRARFLDRTYAAMLITKNVASLVLTAGGAWWFASARMAVAGICVSVAASLLAARRALADPLAKPSGVRLTLARDYMRYAFPVVFANLLYQLIPLTNRTLVARGYGFAETGQFSLSYDLGLRIVAAIGSSLDVLLFQLAVRAAETHGPEKAKEQIAFNMTVVLGLVAPACAGCWLVLPSFERIVVPEEFRGPFAHYLGLLLPGLFCYAMIHFAVNPVFQIARRTGPLIAVAAIAACTNAVLVNVLPPTADATRYALAQSASITVALLCILSLALVMRPRWPRARDILAALGGTALMVAATLPLRGLQPGVLTLALQAVSGATVYAAVVLACDYAGLRRLIATRLRRRPEVGPA